MKVEIFRFNFFEENTYLIYDDTKECVIVDPGCYSQQERDFLTGTIAKLQLKPVLIANTHCHSDHILGISFLKSFYNIPFAANSADAYLLDNAAKYAQVFGWQIQNDISIDIECKDGTELRFGNSVLKCASTPGHTPGGQVIYSEADKFMISGDTLFKGTIGRTDLEGGDYDQLMASIRNVILRFDSLYTVFPGHGDKTSVGEEAGKNPFLGFEEDF
ncbi:MAG: MBL fold metallo-hydrolase [Bacteroidales bacterium]|nr:MBL fold metallo-hydrolase [Bacteroidales bacterium]